jgi:exopolysaccharide biosynthesis polyprenyl glycosylphosphotransferase
VIPLCYQYIPGRPDVDQLDGIPLVNLRTVPLDNHGNACLKRVVDVVGALLGLVLGSPIYLLCAVAVKLSSRGPVFFRQTRVGHEQREFTIYKFRSMRVNDESDTAWSRKTDDRRTRVGAILRKTSLDEIPQLWNVLKGDMSLVGPRPELPALVERFREEIPGYMLKHRVKPGVTGWAQVNGFRGDTSLEERIRYDLEYIENWTLWMDLRILFRTVFGGFWNGESLTQTDRKASSGKRGGHRRGR